MDDNRIESTLSKRRWLLAGCLSLMLVIALCAGTVLVAGRFWLTTGTAALPATEVGEPLEPVASPTETTATVVPEEADSVLPTVGRIAFINPLGQIGTVSPSGEDEHLVTSGTRLYLFPAWSPDGSSLAAIGGDSIGSGVFTFDDEADSEVTSLYFSEAESPIYLYWAPDGDRVSFIAERGSELGLYLAPADGMAESRLLTTGQPLYWNWFDGGERLVFHTGGSVDGARLALVELAEGAEASEIAGGMPAQPGFFQAPGVAASGRYLSYAEIGEDRERWLIIEDLEEQSVERIPHSGSVAMNWSPTRDQLAFISPEFSDREPLLDFHGPLRLVEGGSDEVQLLADGMVLAFFWSPDGQKIAYLSLSDSGSDLTASLPEDARFARRSKGASQRQTPIRLDLWVAEVDSGQTQRLITFQPSALFLTQFLPFFDQYGLSHRLWSPDSRALVLPMVEGEQERIFVVSAEDGRAEPVAEGTVAFWSR